MEEFLEAVFAGMIGKALLWLLLGGPLWLLIRLLASKLPDPQQARSDGD